MNDQNSDFHREIDEKENIPSNPSREASFQDILSSRTTRRRFACGSLTVAASAFFAPAVGAGVFKKEKKVHGVLHH